MSSNTAIVRDATERYRTARREAGESRGAFEAEIKRLGGTPRVETAIRRDTAPSQVAELLGVASTDQTVIRARHMYDGDRLVQLADSYVPLDVAEAAGVENPDPASAASSAGCGTQGSSRPRRSKRSRSTRRPPSRQRRSASRSAPTCSASHTLATRRLVVPSRLLFTARALAGFCATARPSAEPNVSTARTESV